MDSQEIKSKKSQNWRLLCPTWPGHKFSLSEQSQDGIKKYCISATVFTDKEAIVALQKRALQNQITLSTLEVDSFAQALGKDPLLIALSDFSKKPEPSQVIKDYINKNLKRVANEKSDYTKTEYEEALHLVAYGILKTPTIDPSFKQIKEWFKGKNDFFKALKILLSDKKIVSLDSSGQKEKLIFRHDRVRDQILSSYISELILNKTIDAELLTEPFFSEVIGAALVDSENLENINLIDQIRTINPLALFYAFKIFRETEDIALYEKILNSIHLWLTDNKIHHYAAAAQRRVALQVLSEVDSSETLKILQKFPIYEQVTQHALKARFRNGDLSAGIALCNRSQPGVCDPWRDKQIEHAKIRFGIKLIELLDDHLSSENLTHEVRIGALRLAGHLAETRFVDAILICWKTDDRRMEHLENYLWAAAKCGSNNPQILLDPICDAWGNLSDVLDESGSSPRYCVAATDISWAFQEGLSLEVLSYFIEQAKKRKELDWPITYMLRGVDNPDVIEFILKTKCRS